MYTQIKTQTVNTLEFIFDIFFTEIYIYEETKLDTVRENMLHCPRFVVLLNISLTYAKRTDECTFCFEIGSKVAEVIFPFTWKYKVRRGVAVF